MSTRRCVTTVATSGSSAFVRLFGGERRELVADVPSGHHDRETRLEDDLRGIRVDPDVVLGGRDDVAVSVPDPTHDHASLDLGCDLRGAQQCRRHVGQWPQCHQGDLPSETPRCVNQHINGVPVGGSAPGEWESDVAESVLTVTELRRLQGAEHRSIEPCIDRRGLPTPLHGVERVLHAAVEWYIARDHGDRLDLDVRMVECHDERNGVVRRGVRINDEATHGSLLGLSLSAQPA